MRSRAILLLAALTSAYGQLKSLPTSPEVIARPIKGKPIALGTFTDFERNFDTRYFAIGTADAPIDLLGNTRGLYLSGYGAVFTTELGLLLTQGPGPFMATVPKERIAKVHQQKLERLPALRKTMQELMRVAALALVPIPDDQQIVVVVRLDYGKWENTAGLPGQILMRADRKSAMLGQITSTEEQ